jgi:glyoxalase family protein
MTKGIHHITAIASDAKKNHDFYTKVLGLRLVKKTVNQDDLGTYHLFYGDKYGHPGMDLTFFIFQPAMQGRRGNGLVTKISLSVPKDSLKFWEKRLKTLHVKNEGITEKFGTQIIIFFDNDNQQLELVGVDKKELEDTKDIWETTEVSRENAIRSFDSATLSVSDKILIAPILLHVFGYKEEAQDANTTLYKVPHSKRGSYLEVVENETQEYGFNAAGTVHHIAFRAADEKEQALLKQKVVDLGISTTEVIDRFYFKSVYFRTPGGILFEIATDKPGFTADETVEELGKNLALPPFLEHKRKMIELNLPKISTK